MEEQFFSEINRDFVFNQVKDIVMSNHSVNILLDDEYRNIFNKNITEVYNKSDNNILNLEQLNNKVLISTIKLFQDKVNENKKKNNENNINVNDALEKYNLERNNDNNLFKNMNNETKQTSILDGPEINIDNVQSLNDISNNITEISNLPLKNTDKEPIIDKKDILEKNIKKPLKIISNKRLSYQSSRFNYKIDLKSNKIQFNNNKIDKIIIPLENNYIFSSPIIFLKINELKLNVSLILDDIIENNHRKYGVYYCSDNHIIKSKDIKNITIHITDISETIHSNIDTLNIYKLDINEKHIILHNKYIINDYLLNDFIKLVDYGENVIDINSILNVPLKIKHIDENKIYINNSLNIKNMLMDIELIFINLSNQNIIFIK
jgi:hypothetical protein